MFHLQEGLIFIILNFMLNIFMTKITFLLLISCIFISCSTKEDPEPIREGPYTIQENYTAPQFSSDTAYSFIEELITFGPRDPNSKGAGLALNYIVAKLQKYTSKTFLQSFSYPGYDGKILSLNNIIAQFNPEAKNRVFLAAHWDSRPRAERDKDETKRDMPILGVNDGLSGTAILLEIARALKSANPAYGVDIILFDGEDYGREDDLMNFCLGAKYFASNKPQGYSPAFGIVIDMVGDKQAVFYKEPNSVNFAPDITDLVWNTAHKINAGKFNDRTGTPIYDDHIPLNQAGIRTIDIIDADLVGGDNSKPGRDYWHTHDDNLNNIGKESLQQVGDVLLNVIYRIKFNGHMNENL